MWKITTYRQLWLMRSKITPPPPPLNRAERSYLDAVKYENIMSTDIMDSVLEGAYWYCNKDSWAQFYLLHKATKALLHFISFKRCQPRPRPWPFQLSISLLLCGTAIGDRSSFDNLGFLRDICAFNNLNYKKQNCWVPLISEKSSGLP